MEIFNQDKKLVVRFLVPVRGPGRFISAVLSLGDRLVKGMLQTEMVGEALEIMGKVMEPGAAINIIVNNPAVEMLRG